MIIVILILSISCTCYTLSLHRLSSIDYSVIPNEEELNSYKRNELRSDFAENTDWLNELQSNIIQAKLLHQKPFLKQEKPVKSFYQHDHDEGGLISQNKPISLFQINKKILTHFPKYYRRTRAHIVPSHRTYNCGVECYYADQRSLQLKAIFPTLDDRTIFNLIQYTTKKLQNQYNMNISMDDPDMTIWNSFNLSGKREQPFYVEEPHYIIIRKEVSDKKMDYRDDPFIPPRGRKHMPILDDLLNHYDVFIPHRGKKDKLQDIFKYDETFYPNRGKRYPKSDEDEIFKQYPSENLVQNIANKECCDNEYKLKYIVNNQPDQKSYIVKQRLLGKHITKAKAGTGEVLDLIGLPNYF